MTLTAVVRKLTLDQIVSNLARLNADLDAFAAEGVDPSCFEGETKLVRALRDEYRTRTGEIV